MYIYLTPEREAYDFGGTHRDDDGNPVCNFYHMASDDEILTLPRDEVSLPVPLSIGATVQQAPDFFSNDCNYIRLFYPYSMLDNVFADLEADTVYYQISMLPLSEHSTTELYFTCRDHDTSKSAPFMTKLLMQKGYSTSGLINYAASVESRRAMITVINIFSYGFIILISLIAAANVFNTISFLMTWMIYRAIGQGLEIAFFIPWYSIAIAVGSVFLVVFVTMLYSMRKIRRENTIDTLKNENL